MPDPSQHAYSKQSSGSLPEPAGSLLCAKRNLSMRNLRKKTRFEQVVVRIGRGPCSNSWHLCYSRLPLLSLVRHDLNRALRPRARMVTPKAPMRGKANRMKRSSKPTINPQPTKNKAHAPEATIMTPLFSWNPTTPTATPPDGLASTQRLPPRPGPSR